MEGAEAPQQLRTKRAPIVLGTAEAQRTGETRAAQVREHLVVAAEKRFGVHQEALTSGRQAHAGAGAVEQRLTDRLLEATHLHAQRRLRSADFSAGDADRARPRDSPETPKQR